MREIRTVTHLNLGDNIYYVHLFRKIIDLYGGNIRFIHHLHTKYIPEVLNFIKGYEENIILKDIVAYCAEEVIPLNRSSVPMWFVPYPELIKFHREKNNNLAILLYGDGDHWEKHHPGMPGILDTSNFDEVLYRQFIQFCEFMNVDCPISDVYDTLLDMKELLIPNQLTDNYDLLIGNSTPMSAQWSNNKDSFDYLIDRIDLTKVKVISLEPTGNKDIPSTIECGLSLMEVGNIAINTKKIIGIHSSPYCVFINKYNYSSLEETVVLQNWDNKFKYSNTNNSVNYQSDDAFINGYRIPLNWCKI